MSALVFDHQQAPAGQLGGNDRYDRINPAVTLTYTTLALTLYGSLSQTSRTPPVI